MNKDHEIIVEDLRRLGLDKGDAVLVHSSYKSLGAVEGGIQTLVEAILAVIGEGGTLIVPTLTFRDVSETNRVFDYINTPSCVGAVSEYVRHMDGAKRSIHPTHSCAAIGKKRDWYICGHENDRTPVGKNSPIYKLREDGGKILLLGCSTEANTSMHGVEEAFRVSYVLPHTPAVYRVILPDRTYEIDFYRHHIRQNGYAQRYDRLESIMDSRYMRSGVVHGAKSWLIDASVMWKVALDKLKEDEYFFVDDVSKVGLK